MIEIQSPNEYSMGDMLYGPPSIFLAGSIEMGLAKNWQQQMLEAFKDKEVIFLNPRRSDWDSSWEQTVENEKFVEQVNWELDMLDLADYIVMYFDPNTKSPISLLELGLQARSGKMIVCCPDGFWRKGNVEIVCDRHSVPLYHDLETMIEKLKTLSAFD